MDKRVSSSNNTPPPQPPAQPSAPPADQRVTDQAAAEFAALVGADEQQGDANAKLGQEAAGAEAFEAEHAAGDQRVEARGGDGERSGSDDGGESGDSAGDGQSGDAEGQSDQPMSLGDAILKTLARGAEAGPAQQIQGGRDATLDGIVQQIADKILVSEPTSGKKEVRIILKESVLPGTEVRLTQHAGKLQVQLVTESQKSLDLLNQNHQALQQRLNEKLSKHEVVVSVEMEGQGQPDPDGRSRQQQEVADEDDNP